MRRLLPVALLIAVALGPSALAQTQFVIRFQQGTTVQVLTDGATVTFNSEGIGQAVPSTLTLTYRGTTSATINAVELSGSTDFSATSSLPPPFTLNPNDAGSFGIQFNPTVAGRHTARLAISFTEGTRGGTITVNVVGVLPDFGFSYTLPRANQTFLPAGGTIPFPNTNVNQTTAATFTITNRGTGAGTVNNIAISGAPAFTLAGVPLLPAVVQPAAVLVFTVNFTPTRLESVGASIQVDFVGRSSTVQAAGTGLGPIYEYQFVVGSSVLAVSANDTLTFPSANVGERSTAVVRVRNAGNGDGVLTNIRVTGAEFTLTDLPFLPLTLTPTGFTNFTITFAPAQAVSVTGRLRIDDAFFTLAGTGLGATLTYTATVGTTASTLVNNSTLIFPPTQVGTTFAARVQVSNTGNAAAAVNSISVTGAAFSLTEVPGLPARLGAGESLSFQAVFAPATLGASTGTLKIDGLTINLSGVGSDPPALPAVSFPGITATAEPGQQLAAGVSLATPYPINLTGRLVLTFASDAFNDDPAIQFATGGRTINFVVPANTTRAVFGLDATQARLQTGTVAGTITLTALFATETGNINLTAAVAPATTIAVRPSAPRLRSMQVSARTASGFTLLVSGFATSRSVTQLAFQFTQSNETGVKLDTASLTVNVEAPFAAYYQSTASQLSGSQFTATVTFNVRGDIEAIQSVSVTATNALGTSTAVSASLR